MNVLISNENGKTLVTLEGRLDTTNVHDFEKQVAGIMADPPVEVVVECSGFDYISSSGLRIFLVMQKQLSASGGRLVLRNMKPEIREVFDMTGFSSIFTIE